MRWIVFWLFFVSGACGLIYQVVWTRIMTHVFGTTVFAVSIVLTAFMSGLALGSYFLGRISDRSKNPLRLYAVYELGIGLFALAALFLMDRLLPIYLSLHRAFEDAPWVFNVLRFLIAFLIVVAPTILMGATLPVLSRFVITQMGALGRSLGALYSINTFGAVTGSVAAGFWLIRELGVHGTVYVAVGLNLAVGLIAWAGSGKQASNVAAQEKTAPTPATRKEKLLLLAIALSGFTSFAYEIYWTRSLVFLLGNSTYAFVTMLTAFLTGIALGGYGVRFFIDRAKSPLLLFAWAEVLIGVFAALAMPILVTGIYTDEAQTLLHSEQTHWFVAVLLRFGFSFLVMLVPTLFIGATFPLVGKVIIQDLKRTGAEVGRIYAANTAGNIAGAFIPGLLLLPLLGIGKGVLVMAAINLAIGAAILLSRRRETPRALFAVTLALLAGSAFLAWRSSGFQFPSDTQHENDRVLFYKEGIAATTKVYLNPETREKSISVDGANIGGTNIQVNHKQQVLAHLPRLLAPGLKRELSIGLGSGILIGECVRHAELEKLTCLELAPSVVEGAAFFDAENGGVLHHPRVKIIVNDGVNHLMTTEERYDVISSDAKSKPEHGGNGIFFTREYYSLMKEHLTPNGLVIQWIPLYYPESSFLSILKSFTNVFPEASLWLFPPSHGFLVGSIAPVEVDYPRMQAMLAGQDAAVEGLKRYGITSASALLAHCVASGDTLKRISADAADNDFDRPSIEFYSFKDYAVPAIKRTLENNELLLKIREKTYAGPFVKGTTPADEELLTRCYRAQGLYLKGQSQVSTGKARYQQSFDEALAMAPEDEAIQYYIGSHHQIWAQKLIRQERFDQAEAFVDQALKIYGRSGKSLYLKGFLLAKQGAYDEAEKFYLQALSLEPDQVRTRRELAGIYRETGRFEEALNQLRYVVETIDAEHVEALVELGRVLVEDLGRYDEGVLFLERAYALAPDRATVIDGYGWALFQQGQTEKARQVIQEGGGYYTDDPAFARRRSTVLQP